MKNAIWLSTVALATTLAATLAATASPARAESKVSQCKRFDQAMTQLGQNLSAAKSRSNQDPIERADKAMAVLKAEVKKLESRKFTDRKIQAFQTQAVGMFIAAHNDLLNVVNASEKGDRSTAQASYQRLKQIDPRIEALARQFTQYCQTP